MRYLPFIPLNSFKLAAITYKRLYDGIGPETCVMSTTRHIAYLWETKMLIGNTCLRRYFNKEPERARATNVVCVP